MLLYGIEASEASIINLVVCMGFFYLAAIIAHSNTKYKYPEKSEMLLRGGVSASVVEQLPFWTAAKATMASRASELEPQIGLASIIYLRFCRVMVESFGLFGLMGLLILAPANWTGGGGQRGLDRMSASNLLYGSERATLHCLYALGFTVFMYAQIQRFRKFCVERLSDSQSNDEITACTVMIKNFPFQVMDNDYLREHIEARFPGSITNVRIVADQTPRIRLVQRLEFVQGQLDAFRSELREKNVRPKLVSGPLKSLGQGEKVDAISVLAAERERLEEQLEMMKSGAMSNSGHAFVTFASRATANEFRLQGREPLFGDDVVNERSYVLEAHKWRLVPAPPAADIIWQNLPLNPDGRVAPLLFTVIVGLCSLCVIVLPVMVVVALGDNRALGGEFVAMSVPPLTLVVMRELLYPMFFADNINKLRPTTRSALRSLTFWLNFSFNLLASVVVPYICFGWLNVYYQKMSMTAGMVQTALASLYSVGGQFYFLNSLFMSAFLSTGVQLLFYAFRPMLATRYSSFGEVNEPIYFNYPQQYALTVVLVAMMLACAAVSPVVMVSGTLCLAIRFLVDKYHHLQTYTRRDDYVLHAEPNSACVSLVMVMLLFHLSLFHWFAGQGLWVLAIVAFCLALFDTACIITPRVRDQFVTVHPSIQGVVDSASTPDKGLKGVGGNAYNVPEVHYAHQQQVV
jgi:hypothetical protein